RAPFSVFSFSTNRGRIGVIVKTEPDPSDDKVGARIEAVTPGGPADDAGLKAGDIITRFRGATLGGARADDDDESGPGMKLIELARALDPGDTVEIEYRRGNDNRKATLVAEDLESAWSLTLPHLKAPRVDPDIRLHIEEDLPGFSYMWGEPWGRLELVTLNPDLAEYFGTREGVHVVKAPPPAPGDSAHGLALRGGDVILSIGGRKPSSPSHAMRILRSYETGETVSLEIVRKQKRSTITWKVPESDGHMRRLRPLFEYEEPSFFKFPEMPRILKQLRGVLGEARAI
ncbi:MAG: PDZ domain-containing protein, partial [Gemmatimonadales bacterium]